MYKNEEEIPWPGIEDIIRRDLANRGLSGHRPGETLLGFGQLELAAKHLAQFARHVAIVTGFFIEDAPAPAAETDGPPGALYLADALLRLGIEVSLITDCYGVPLLEAGCEFLGMPTRLILEVPISSSSGLPSSITSLNEEKNADLPFDLKAYLHDSKGNRISHLISIERVGPTHTLHSVQNAALFQELVPAEYHDTCRNHQGTDIGKYTAATHLLFEHIQQNDLPICTIGIGDGGNEIGMGSFPWATLREAIPDDPSGKTICRIATNFSLIAGVSNWASYALGLALCCVKNRANLAAPWNIGRQEKLIRYLVEQAGALDGISKQNIAQVDGLNMPTYLQQLADLRCLLGYEA